MSQAHGKKSPLAQLFDLHGWVGWMADWGVSRALFLGVLLIGLLLILGLLIENLPTFAFWWIVGTAPLWLPIVLIRGSWHAWIEYIREEHLSKRKSVLLEVKIPRDIMKSPRAMELVFNSLFRSSGEVTFLMRCWHGSVRPWTSWEIASFGGEIHFYTWCFEKDRRFIESFIYAQYPEVEIFQVEDYATRFVFDPDKYTCYVTDYVLDPRSDAYPIKSYIDYELDKDPKEELKVDPMASVLEVLSTIKPSEQMWVQILVRSTGKDTGHHALNPGSGKDAWQKRVEKEINKIRKQSAILPGKEEDEAENPDEKNYGTSPRPDWKQQEQIKAMQRHLGKVPFDVGMRGIYISEGSLGDAYNVFRWLWKPYNSPSYFNQLRPKRAHNDFDYPWQDIRNMRWVNITRRYLDAYRQRSFFYTPYASEHFVMSPEILATLYHYPSRTVQTPGLQRIAAKKMEPPPNLPR